MKLFAARYRLSPDLDKVSEEGNPWTFGQILPVMLLAGQAFSIMGVFGAEIKRQHATSRRTSWPQEIRSSPPETTQSTQNQLSASRTKLAPIEGSLLFDIEFSSTSSSIQNRIQEDRDWVNRDYYSDASWIGMCILPLTLCIVIFTFIFYRAQIDYSFGLEFGDFFDVLDTWIDDMGLLYYFLIGLPGALAIDIAMALISENLLFRNNGTTLWIRKAAFFVVACLPYLFLCLALLVFQWQPQCFGAATCA